MDLESPTVSFLKRPSSRRTSGRSTPAPVSSNLPSKAKHTATQALNGQHQGRSGFSADGKALPGDKLAMMREMRAFEAEQRALDKANRARRHDQKQEQRKEAAERQLMGGEDLPPYSEEGRRRLFQWQCRLEMEVEDALSRKAGELERRRAAEAARRAQMEALRAAMAERQKEEEEERARKEAERDRRRREAAARRRAELEARRAAAAEAERERAEAEARAAEEQRAREENERDLMEAEEDNMRRFLALAAEQAKWAAWEAEQEAAAAEEAAQGEKLAAELASNKKRLAQLQALKRRKQDAEKARLEEQAALRKARAEAERLSRQMRIEARAKALARKERRGERGGGGGRRRKKKAPAAAAGGRRPSGGGGGGGDAEAGAGGRGQGGAPPQPLDASRRRSIGKLDLGGTVTFNSKVAAIVNEYAGNEDVECMTPRTLGKQQRECMRKKRTLKIQKRKWLEEFREREGRAPQSTEEKREVETIDGRVAGLEARERALKARALQLKEQEAMIRTGTLRPAAAVDASEEVATFSHDTALAELASKLIREAEDTLQATAGKELKGKLNEKKKKTELRRCAKAKRNIKLKAKEWCDAYKDAFGKEPEHDAKKPILELFQAISIIERRESELDSSAQEDNKENETKISSEEAQKVIDARADEYRAVAEHDEADYGVPDDLSEDSWKLPASGPNSSREDSDDGSSQKHKDNKPSIRAPRKENTLGLPVGRRRSSSLTGKEDRNLKMLVSQSEPVLPSPREVPASNADIAADTLIAKVPSSQKDEVKEQYSEPNTVLQRKSVGEMGAISVPATESNVVVRSESLTQKSTLKAPVLGPEEATQRKILEKETTLQAPPILADSAMVQGEKVVEEGVRLQVSRSECGAVQQEQHKQEGPGNVLASAVEAGAAVQDRQVEKHLSQEFCVTKEQPAEQRTLTSKLASEEMLVEAVSMQAEVVSQTKGLEAKSLMQAPTLEVGSSVVKRETVLAASISRSGAILDGAKLEDQQSAKISVVQVHSSAEQSTALVSRTSIKSEQAGEVMKAHSQEQSPLIGSGAPVETVEVGEAFEGNEMGASPLKDPCLENETIQGNVLNKTGGKPEEGSGEADASTDIMKLWLSKATQARDDIVNKTSFGDRAAQQTTNSGLGWNEMQNLQEEMSQIIKEFEEAQDLSDDESSEMSGESLGGGDSDENSDGDSNEIDPDLDLPGWNECLDSNLPTTAHAAAKFGYYEVLEYLCQMFDVYVTDDMGRTPLFYACVSNQISCAALLVSHGAEWVNVGDSRGDTPLHAAVLSDSTELVDFLLDCDADPGIANFSGLTPGHLSRSVDTIKALKEKGADVHCIDNASRMPLYFACERGDVDTVAYLCEVMDSNWIGWADQNGNTALHVASENGQAECLSCVCDAAWQWSVLNAVNAKGLTPVHLARDEGALQALFESGAELFFLDKQERMPLFFAAAKGLTENLAFFLETASWSHPHAIPHADKNGDTALHAAALKGHKDCVSLLLQYFQNPHVTNKAGLAAADLAETAGYGDIAELIRDWVPQYNGAGTAPRLFDTSAPHHRLMGMRWARMVDPASGAAYFEDQCSGHSQWDPPGDYDGLHGDAPAAARLLSAFYSEISPEKVELVSKIIEERQENLDGIFIALADKYGNQFKEFMAHYQASQQLHQFYEKFKPENIAKIPAILEEWKGRFDDLFKTLTEKYGALDGTQQMIRLSSSRRFDMKSCLLHRVTKLAKLQLGPITALTYEEARARLVAFYEKVNPLKVKDCDAILEAYGDDLGALFRNLEAKYGRLEDLQKQDKMSKEEARELLSLFYSYYNPEKLSLVDTILAQRVYDLEGLFHELESKYGVKIEKNQLEASLAAMAEARTTLTDFYEKYHPERLEYIEEILWQYRDDYNKLWHKLEQKYSIPIVSKMDRAMARKRLANLYSLHNPGAMWDIEGILDEHQEDWEGLFVQLELKYRGSEKLTKKEARSQLEAFYTAHNPDQLDKVEAILQQYAGRYGVLFRKLEVKYGVTTKEASAFRTKDSKGSDPEGAEESSKDPFVFLEKQAFGKYFSYAEAEDLLQQIYSIHNPGQLPKIQAILAQYDGNYDVMFRKLSAKYGHQSTPIQSDQGSSDPEGAEESSKDPFVFLEKQAFGKSFSYAEAEDLLQQIYSIHNPGQLPKIQAILAQYDGNYDVMFRKLSAKYGHQSTPIQSDQRLSGPETASESEREQDPFTQLAKRLPGQSFTAAEAEKLLKQIYRIHNPAQLSKVGAILDQYDGNYEVMFQKLAVKYGGHFSPSQHKKGSDPEGAEETSEDPFVFLEKQAFGKSFSYAEAEDLLQQVYSIHNPGQLSKIQAILAQYDGNYDVMFRRLSAKYGHQSTPIQSDQRLSGPETASESEREQDPFTQLAKRLPGQSFTAAEAEKLLKQIYRIHNPAQLSKVGAILDQYDGNYAVMFQKLAVKYGGHFSPSQQKDQQRQAVATSAVGDEDGKEDPFLFLEAMNPSVPVSVEFADQHLRKIYARYEPEKLSVVPGILKHYQNDIVGLFRSLQAKYVNGGNLERPFLKNQQSKKNGGSVRKSTLESSSRTSKEYEAAREKLVAFYSKHNPERLHSVDAILEQYKDDLGALFVKLESKYKNIG